MNNFLKNPIHFHKRNPLAIVFISWVGILIIFVGLFVGIGIFVKNLFMVVSNPVYNDEVSDVRRIDKAVPYKKIDTINEYFTKKQENISTLKETINKVQDPSI